MRFVVLLLVGCTDTRDHTPTPKGQHEFRCSSKSAGSTPQCWNEQDWEIFCKRVECKKNE